jgi:hypothetical protein
MAQTRTANGILPRGSGRARSGKRGGRRISRLLRVPVIGGAVDGAVLEVPHRTSPGLRLELQHGMMQSQYELLSVAGRLQAVPSAGR